MDKVNYTAEMAKKDVMAHISERMKKRAMCIADKAQLYIEKELQDAARSGLRTIKLSCLKYCQDDIDAANIIAYRLVKAGYKVQVEYTRIPLNVPAIYPEPFDWVGYITVEW